MKKYQCHKVVEGMKIDTINIHSNGDVTLIGYDKEEQLVSKEWMERHKPGIGGYFVCYEDNYTSWSPTKVFEDGYTELKENEVIEYDAVDLLDIRNFIEKVLTRDSSIKFGGSAGTSLIGGGADIDILINDRRFNINIKPR